MLSEVDEPVEERSAVLALTIPRQLVLERLASTTAMHDEVLHLHESVEVSSKLGMPPPRALADQPAAEPEQPPNDSLWRLPAISMNTSIRFKPGGTESSVSGIVVVDAVCRPGTRSL